MEHSYLKLYHNPNPNDFLAKNIEDRPNRFTCYINFKLMLGGRVQLSSKCSGVLLAEDCLLTAAHGVKAYLNAKERMQNLHLEPSNLSYVKLALHQGSSRGKYSIKHIRKSKHYDGTSSNMHDFALLMLNTNKQLQEKQSNFPAVLAISPKTMTGIKEVSVLGYPIRTNQQNCPLPSAQSSIFMSNQYESSGPLLKAEGSMILYTIPTEQGFSGGPLFTEYKGEQVVIALHKATTFSQRSEKEMFQHNLGVNAQQMLEELNQWGFQLHKKPFVFTQKTINMREFFKNIEMREMLSFMDKELDLKDLNVMLSYEWSRLKFVNLSGNPFGEEGFLCLTKRKFEQLQSLSLEQTEIQTLEQVPNENWHNLSTLTILSLNLNGLSCFPEGLSLLENLKEIGLAYNNFKQIPENFLTFCRTRTRAMKVTLYKNKIRDEKHLNQDKLREIAKTLVTCILVREQELREDDGL